MKDGNTMIAIPADPADPEDFDVTVAELAAARRSREIRRVRKALGLSQPEFAERYRVPVGTLRDWEQARVTPPEFAVAYARAISAAPDSVAQAVSVPVAAEERLRELGKVTAI